MAVQLSTTMQGMAITAASNPRTRIRRKDRAVEDDAWIAALLRRAPVGVLATSREGQPFINTNTFVYDDREHAVYMHTSHAGRTPQNVGEVGRVCFSVFETGRLLPADRAFSMSIEYRAAVVFGQARILAGAAAKRRALRLLVEKYFSHLSEGADYAPATDEEIALTAVYRIDIEEWSGKQKAGEADHPGAFTWPREPA